MNDELFSSLVQRFFTEHLRAQRDLSPHTVASYADSFRLLLKFLSAHHSKPVDHLTFRHLSADAVLAFLSHIEAKRRNCVRTRNARLSAIHSFVRFALGETPPEFLLQGQRLLAVPFKRTVKPLLGFMDRDEVRAVLAAVNIATWSGRRDHLMFSLLYNTGARVSEILQVRPLDLQDRLLLLQGKGRKLRRVPLWWPTVRQIHQWVDANQIGPDQRLFPNRCGGPLTRKGVAFRLRIAVVHAQKTCPSLSNKKITPHTWRHSAAMGLLHAGVPLEVIALWLGHSQPVTTHGYIEADLELKRRCMRRLEKPPALAKATSAEFSHLLGFLEAV